MIMGGTSRARTVLYDIILTMMPCQDFKGVS